MSRRREAGKERKKGKEKKGKGKRKRRKKDADAVACVGVRVGNKCKAIYSKCCWLAIPLLYIYMYICR